MFHFLKCPRPLRAKAADFSTNFIHYSLKIMRGAITAPTAPHVKNCVWLHVCRYANTLDTRASMYRRVQQRTALRHFSAVTAAHHHLARHRLGRWWHGWRCGGQTQRRQEVEGRVHWGLRGTTTLDSACACFLEVRTTVNRPQADIFGLRLSTSYFSLRAQNHAQVRTASVPGNRDN